MKTIFVLIFTLYLASASNLVPFEEIHVMTSDKLGQGGFGSVFKAFSKRTFRKYAVKVGDKSDKFQEVPILKELTAKNIPNSTHLRFYKVADGKEYIGLDLFKGDLAYFIEHENGSRQDRIKEKVAYQLFEALASFEKLGYTHFDIKPQNILLDQDFNAYLADFGLASKASETVRCQMGTMFYFPEDFEDDKCDQRRDSYALGMVVTELFAGNSFKGSPYLVSLANRHEEAEKSDFKDLPASINYKEIVLKYMLVPASKRWTPGKIFETFIKSFKPQGYRTSTLKTFLLESIDLKFSEDSPYAVLN